jgi:hypothetical protein
MALGVGPALCPLPLGALGATLRGEGLDWVALRQAGCDAKSFECARRPIPLTLQWCGCGKTAMTSTQICGKSGSDRNSGGEKLSTRGRTYGKACGKMNSTFLTWRVAWNWRWESERRLFWERGTGLEPATSTLGTMTQPSFVVFPHPLHVRSSPNCPEL